MRTLGKAILNVVSDHVDWKLRQRQLAQQFYAEQARSALAQKETEREGESDPPPPPIGHRRVKHAL